MRNTLVALTIFVLSAIAHADPWFHHDHPRDFYDHDHRTWAAGNWYHGNYQGRFGWYWVVGETYYFYPKPIYPFPNPYIPPTIVAPIAPIESPVRLEAQPQQQVWYFCEASNAYYPYVSECNGEWKKIPATPPSPKP
jgi:hypothetical protein